MFGFNLQKLESATYTSMNLKNNSNMVVKIRPLNGVFYMELEMKIIQKVLCQNGCIFIWFMNVSLKSVQIL